MSEEKIAAITSLLLLILLAVMIVVLMHKKRNSQPQPGHAPHGAGHGGGHGGGGAHAHHPPTAWQVFQFTVGGPIIWFDWAGECDKALKFWPGVMMVAFCLLNILFWRNTGIVFLILWGLLTLLFVWLAIAGRKGSKPSEWHLHAHYWDAGSEWVIGTVVSWGFMALVSWVFLWIVSDKIRKDVVREVARAEMQVAKTKATSWSWEHNSPAVENDHTDCVLWETGPTGKVVFQSLLTTGDVATVSYSAGSDEGAYEDTRKPGIRWVIKPLGDLKSGIPSFEGKSQALGFQLLVDGQVKGIITLKPMKLKYEHRKGTQ